MNDQKILDQVFVLDMLNSLSFFLILMILFTWIISWSLIAVVIATAKGRDSFSALLQGMTFGPVGVLFILIRKINPTLQDTSKSTNSIVRNDTAEFSGIPLNTRPKDELYR